jgi:small conductance mechanosensitive channel
LLICKAAFTADLLSAKESTPPSPPPHTEIENLIKVLENDQSRQALIDDLKKLLKTHAQAKEATPEYPAINLILSGSLQEVTDIFMDLRDQGKAVVKFLKSPVVQNILIEFLWIIILALAVGYGGEWLFLKLFHRFLVTLQSRVHKGLLSKTQILSMRLMIWFPGLLIFTVLASIVTYSLPPQPRAQHLVLLTIAIAVFYKIYHMILDCLLSPGMPALRLVPLKDMVAMTLYRFLMITGIAFSVAYVLSAIFHVLQASNEALFLVIKLSTVMMSGLFIYFSGRLKPYVNQWISQEKLVEGKSSHGFNHFIIEVARSWYPVLITWIIVIALVILSSDATHYGRRIHLLLHTSLIIILTYLLVLLLPKLVRLGLRHIAERYPLIKPRLRTYRRICSSMLIVVVVVTAIFYSASLWQIGLLDNFISTQNHQVILHLFSFSFILMLGIIAWEMNELVCERKFNRSTDQPISPEALKRLKTLKPLVRNTGRGFIILFITLMCFSELGLNIAPLLAGASVFGIALSLGGQTLVKDIITGSFILIEDTMNIGDYVEISGHSGRIESMSLRTVTLRDSQGGVHSIPFSAINTVVNFSKSFSMCVFNFVIDQTIDIQRVTQIVKDVDQSMRTDPKWASLIIEPIEILGVPTFDNESYTLRAQLKVAPGKQWSIEREMNWRFAEAFKKGGIKGPLNKQWMIVEQAPTHSIPSTDRSG